MAFHDYTNYCVIQIISRIEQSGKNNHSVGGEYLVMPNDIEQNPFVYTEHLFDRDNEKNRLHSIFQRLRH